MTNEGKAQLGKDEEERKFPYDDATGKPLKKGDIIIGNISIGIGRNLFAQGLAKDEIDFCFNNNIRDFEEFLFHTFSKWCSFSPRRQDALVNLCFNTGDAGFLEFHKMVAAIKAGDWETASKECKDSEVYRQRPDRIGRIANALKEG